MKKIAILYNLNRNEHEYEAEFDSQITIDTLENVLKFNYEVYKIEAVKDFSWIKALQQIKPDLVFNICEGFYGPARESVYAGILEQLGFNYSGPDSTNLLICHNKFLTKNLLKNQFLTPKGYCLRAIEELHKIKNLKYPLIVKLNSEGSSLGMSGKSIVHNLKGLQIECKKLINKYKRAILLEEYIDGNDISMAYVEGIGALGPCFVKCNSKFYDFEMKTIKDETVQIEMSKGKYVKLKNEVENIAKILDIKGYAKMDFREKDGKYYLIEVNSQVSFHPKGEFIVCAQKDGYNFNDIVNHITKFALSKKIKENSIGLGGFNE